jgi:hypothetical protein
MSGIGSIHEPRVNSLLQAIQGGRGSWSIRGSLEKRPADAPARRRALRLRFADSLGVPASDPIYPVVGQSTRRHRSFPADPEQARGEPHTAVESRKRPSWVWAGGLFPRSPLRSPEFRFRLPRPQQMCNSGAECTDFEAGADSGARGWVADRGLLVRSGSAIIISAGRRKNA